MKNTGMFTVLERKRGAVTVACECNGVAYPIASAALGTVRGQHCGCAYILPEGWCDAYPRGPNNSPVVFKQWLNLPHPKPNYLTIVLYYKFEGKPSSLTLIDPTKPATLENIKVTFHRPVKP